MLAGSPALNRLSYQVLACCFEVHRRLGPGLLESIYEECVSCELVRGGLHFQRQHEVPIRYRGKLLGQLLRVDFLIENYIVLEIKAIEEFHPVHTAQILTYLKLLEKPMGLLVNFNTAILTDGIKRILRDRPQAKQ